MIKKILLRLLHIIKSDSNKGFGIHSPFVFDFVVNVLNEKNGYYAYSEIENVSSSSKQTKYLKLLYRIINYYRVRNILIVGNDGGVLLDKIIPFCPSLYIKRIDNLAQIGNVDNYDFIYVAVDTNDIHCSFSRDTIIVIENLFDYRQHWKSVKIAEIPAIFIDFFDFGIIFAKNNFIKQFYRLIL